MGVKYRNTFYSLAGDLYQIDIHDSLYTVGDVSDFKTDKAGFQISYQNLSQRLDSIFASNCNIPFIVENSTQEAFINSMMTGAEERFGVIIYKNSAKYWLGILTTDMIQNPDEYYPYQVDLKFTDGLGRLADKFYNQDGTETSTNPYTGRENIVKHIKNCLVRTGTLQYFSATDTLIKSVCNYYERHHVSASNNPLEYSDALHIAFYEYDEAGVISYMTCLEVLQNILTLFNLRIFMAGGVYFIMQPQEYCNTLIRAWWYDKSGVYKGYSANDYMNLYVSSANLTRMAGGTSRYLPALSYVKRTYKWKGSNGYQGSLIPVQSTYSTPINFLNGVSGGAGEYLQFTGSVDEYYTGHVGDSQWMPVYSLKILLTVGSTVYYATGGESGVTWTTSTTGYIKLYGCTRYLGTAGHMSRSYDLKTDVLPGSGTATFQFTLLGFVNGAGSSYTPGGTFSFTCQNYGVYLITLTGSETAGETNYTATNGVNPTATQKIELKDSVLGDGIYTTDIGALRAYGTSWSYTFGWKVGPPPHYSTIRLIQLAANENVTGQQGPVEVYQGAFVGTLLKIEKCIKWTSGGSVKTLVPIMLTIHPAEDMYIGQWFNANIPAF